MVDSDAGDITGVKYYHVEGELSLHWDKRSGAGPGYSAIVARPSPPRWVSRKQSRSVCKECSADFAGNDLAVRIHHSDRSSHTEGEVLELANWDAGKAQSRLRCKGRRRRRTRQLVACCRPRNAYIFFTMTERPRLVAANCQDSFGQISKMLGQTWRNMSDADKEVSLASFWNGFGRMLNVGFRSFTEYPM